MATSDELPLTRTQRAHPVFHLRHVSGGLMVHMTGMMGFAHAYYVLDLRHRDGRIGYGGRIHGARFKAERKRIERDRREASRLTGGVGPRVGLVARAARRVGPRSAERRGGVRVAWRMDVGVEAVNAPPGHALVMLRFVARCSRRVDIAGATAKGGAAPVGRAASGASHGRLGRLAERTQVALNLLGLGHERDEPQAPRAAWAAQHVHRERPLHQLRPAAIATAARTRLGLCVGVLDGADLLGRLGQDARTKLTRGGEHADVTHSMEARRRHRRAEPCEERERIEIHRERPVGESLLERDAHKAVGTLA